jgi:hypothetical protein
MKRVGHSEVPLKPQFFNCADKLFFSIFRLCPGKCGKCREAIRVISYRPGKAVVCRRI